MASPPNTSKIVRREDVGGVAVLSLARPPVNGIAPELVEALAEQVAAVERDNSRSVLLRSDLDGMFMAGADVKVILAALEEGDAATLDGLQAIVPLIDRLAALPKPTVVAIDGVAAGGGLELALACDIRICSHEARVGLPESRLGLLPGGGGTQRLTRLIGPGRALDLMLDGRLIDAEEAAALGIVSEVVPREALAQRALARAARLALAAPLAVAGIKRAVAAAAREPAGGFAVEQEVFQSALHSEDAREGIRAFLERRPAAFRGH